MNSALVMPAAGPAGQPGAVSAGEPVIVQRVRKPDGSVLVNVFNTGDLAADFLVSWEAAGLSGAFTVAEIGRSGPVVRTASGLHLSLAPHQSRLLQLRPE